MSKFGRERRHERAERAANESPLLLTLMGRSPIMRVRFSILIAAALAGCSDNNPTTPTRLAAPAGRAERSTDPVFCAHSKIYPLAQNTRQVAWESVGGHSLPNTAYSYGSFDYSLDVTQQIASDLEQSAIDGCGAKLTFVTGGDVGVLGNGQASVTATTHVEISAFAGETDVSTDFQDDYSAPPLPSGCPSVVCIVSNQRIVTVPTSLQTTFQPGGRITVHGDATAYVNAGGTSVWDQALASFAIPKGWGQDPSGPLLVVTFP
jgi:hypothetical protein